MLKWCTIKKSSANEADAFRSEAAESVKKRVAALPTAAVAASLGCDRSPRAGLSSIATSVAGCSAFSSLLFTGLLACARVPACESLPRGGSCVSVARGVGDEVR